MGVPDWEPPKWRRWGEAVLVGKVPLRAQSDGSRTLKMALEKEWRIETFSHFLKLVKDDRKLPLDTSCFYSFTEE